MNKLSLLFISFLLDACLSSSAFCQPFGENEQTVNNRVLFTAIQAGDSATALVLLDGLADVNIPQADGTTALHWAVQQNDLALAEALIRANANVNSKNRYGISAIYLAAQNGSASILSLLLTAGANPNEEFNEGETVLMTAARTGDYATVETLLKKGAVVNARELWHGQTALMWAAAQHHAELIPLLLAYGADVEATANIEEWERQVTAEPRAKWLPPGGMTPLLFAAREGCLNCIRELLNAGAKINAVTPKGISSLLISIINGHYDIAWELISANADINIVDDTARGPLYAAVDFNTMPESNRPSPQVITNSHTSLDLIAALLKKGAEPNAQLISMIPYRLKLDRGSDSMLRAGTTPYLRAAKGGDIQAMNLLLEYGADATLTTDQGFNPLMTAANLGTREADTTGRYKTEEQIIAAIQVSLDQGLDINAKNNNGRTAIFGAAMFGLDQVVQFLVNNGATLDYQDNQELSPLDAAMGKAGGFGFVGADGVFQESTVALIQQLF